MSMGFSVGNARWKQGTENDETLELSIPIVLPPSVRPRDLTVEIKDLAVLCVRHKDASILQWRLYDSVAAEVEWHVENEKTLVVDLLKKSASPWPCLLNLAMDPKSSLFLGRAELDRLFLDHHPPLPPLDSDEGATTNAKLGQSDAQRKSNNDSNADDPTTESKNFGGESSEKVDLDKLLEEAAEEVTGATKTEGQNGNNAEEEDTMREFVQAELENYQSEAEEITKKLLEVNGNLELAGEGEEADKMKTQKAVLEKMLRLHETIREMRTQPSSLDNFLTLTKLEINKARTNVGAMTDEEEEDYVNDSERAMPATQLMETGLHHLKAQDLSYALHYLRLAAIHHRHEQSTIILYSLYAQLGSSRGPFLLLKHALQDDDLSAATNLKVGELFDTGARNFLPMLPAAFFFYQRAAQSGSVHAMLALAQLHLRGCTATTLMSEAQRKPLQSLEKYHGWLRQATDRGCGSAYFVEATMYLKGEHGYGKSYQMAKELLDKAATAQPDIIQRAPQIYLLLENLRLEEERGEEEDGLTSATASNPMHSTTTESGAPARVGVTQQNGAATTNGDHTVQVTSSLDRLNNMVTARGTTGGAAASEVARGRGPGTMLRSKKMTSGAGSGGKAFWERAVTTGLTFYSLYTLAFPIRIMMLPHFYTLLSQCIDRIPWLSASQPPMKF